MKNPHYRVKERDIEANQKLATLQDQIMILKNENSKTFRMQVKTQIEELKTKLTSTENKIEETCKLPTHHTVALRQII